MTDPFSLPSGGSDLLSVIDLWPFSRLDIPASSCGGPSAGSSRHGVFVEDDPCEQRRFLVLCMHYRRKVYRNRIVM